VIIELDKANKSQCREMISYFLARNAVEAVIKYTERLYEIIDFEQAVLRNRRF